MRGAWRRLVALLSTTEDGLSLALVRILVGLTIFTHLGRLLLVGAVPLIWVDASEGGLRTLKDPWMDALGGATSWNTHVVLAGTMASALLLTFGVGTRVATLLTWLGFRLLDDLNSHAGGSYGGLLVDILFLLLLSGCGERLSVDARFRGAPRPVLAWPRWVLVFQLVVMYFSTALQKLSDHWVPWGAGDALWYILQQPTWQRVPMEWAAPLYPLLRVSTLVAWTFEMTSPLLLLAFWYRRTRERPGWLRARFNALDVRTLYLALGFAMHVGIEVSMDVGAFFPATMALYVACFTPDEWGRRLGRVLEKPLPAAKPG